MVFIVCKMMTKLFFKGSTVLLFCVCLLSCSSFAQQQRQRNGSLTSCRGEAICPSCIQLSWKEREPYIYSDPHLLVNRGIFQMILEFMMGVCCGQEDPKCWEFSYPGDQDELETDVANTSGVARITFPIIVPKRDLNSPTYDDLLVSLIPPSGVAFLTRRDAGRNQSKEVLMSVFNAWPALIMVLLFSILAGIVIWIMDTWINPDMFPRSFVRGTWEGFWWAFISMTTVGYGDRTPKSVCGRLFAVIWILIGICMFSIFTATLASSLTAINLESKIGLTGTKVAVLKTSIEEEVGRQRQAKVVGYFTVEEIKKAMDNEKVKGALIDDYVYIHYKELFPKEVYRVQEILEQDGFEYGARVTNRNMSTCFRRIRYTQTPVLEQLIDAVGNSKEKTQVDTSTDDGPSLGLFDPNSPLFIPAIVTCGGLIFVVATLAVLWHLLTIRKPCPRKKRKEGDENGVLMKSLPDTNWDRIDLLEQAINAEIHQVFDKWREKIASEQSTPV